MSENSSTKRTEISEANSVKEIAAFWETHSLADHWEETKPAHFTVRALRRRRVTLDPEIFAQIEALAQKRGVMPETLVNLWLSERLQRPVGTP